VKENAENTQRHKNLMAPADWLLIVMPVSYNHKRRRFGRDQAEVDSADSCALVRRRGLSAQNLGGAKKRLALFVCGKFPWIVARKSKAVASHAQSKTLARDQQPLKNIPLEIGAVVAVVTAAIAITAAINPQ
jgi:hypothetical protein